MPRQSASLSETPYPLENPPGVVKHLKADHLCNHEYRDLPNAQRLFYKILSREEIDQTVTDASLRPQWESDTQRGLVVYYAEPHPT